MCKSRILKSSRNLCCHRSGILEQYDFYTTTQLFSRYTFAYAFYQLLVITYKLKVFKFYINRTELGNN